MQRRRMSVVRSLSAVDLKRDVSLEANMKPTSGREKQGEPFHSAESIRTAEDDQPAREQRERRQQSRRIAPFTFVLERNTSSQRKCQSDGLLCRAG